MSSNMDSTALDELVRSQVGERRYLHCVRTAKTCEELALRFGEDIDGDLCRRCGLLHDIARAWPADELLRYVDDRHLPLEPEERRQPVLLHAPVGSDFLARRNLLEPEGCLAVRYHTLGSPSMGRLGLILFIADYLEPGRTHIDDDGRRFLLAHSSLEEVCLAILVMQDEYYERKHIVPASCTVRLRKTLEEGGRL